MDKENVIYSEIKYRYKYGHEQNKMLFRCIKQEILPFVTTGMNLRGILLSEICQAEILYGISYLRNLQEKKS